MKPGSGDTSPAPVEVSEEVDASGPGSLSTPFTIGSVPIPNRVVLAPMAGLTTSAYRRHLRAHGAGLVTTEMVSAYGLCHGNKRTHDYLHFLEEERPIAVQLFGDVPEVMAEAARLVLSQEGVRGAAVPDLLDINMGCPVRKVMRTGAGAALLAEPDRAVAVAAAVVEAAGKHGVPVTVKLRSGLQEGERTAVELASRLEGAGVAAIGVHPRAAVQHYRGLADHTVTAEVVQAVGIPVIASGDVMSVSAAHEIREATGATAVMVARGVAGDPWLVDGLLAGAPRPRPALPGVIAELRALLALVIEEMGPQRAVKWMWRPVGWYLRPSRVAPATIERVRRAADGDALDEALAALCGG
jgi:tRNA-dihydrouridine synthase B